MQTLPAGDQAALATVTAVITIAITFFDLVSTFSTGAPSARQLNKSGWWWGFLFANGVLSVLLWMFLQRYPPFRSWNPWAFSLAIGLAYPAFARLKFATVTLNEQQVSIGLEGLYDGAREYVYARINESLRIRRTAKAQALMVGHDVKSLGRKVRFDIEFDSLSSVDEKAARLKWLLNVVKDDSIDDEDKKQFLAIALINGAPMQRRYRRTAAPSV